MGPTRLCGILLILIIASVESLSPLQLIPENETPFLNFGLEGVVTQADWDKATRNDLEDPVFTHPTLGNGTDVIGKHMVTINERPIFAFKGIRYGLGPVDGPFGNNKHYRFKPTVDPGRYWEENGALDATLMGDKCSQKAMLGQVPSGSDDCLFLNVFTPKHPDEIGDDLLPVMLFIHGGAFVSGDLSLYLPTKLLDEDVILVTIQYRLGTQGFFALLNDDAPGNAALYDQQLSLKWVQSHIEGFGGDPEKVTIFGESAGSVSVNYHLILPSSGGLFRGVIGESGSALEHWALDFDPIESAEMIAGLHGCDITTRETIYECMMTKTEDEMAMVMAHYVAQDRKNAGMGFRGASPVNQATEDAAYTDFNDFIVEKDPEQYYLDGDINDVNLLIGCNKNEGSFVLGIVYLEYLLEHPEQFNDDTWMRDELLALIMNAFGVKDQTNGIAESLDDAYLGGADLANFNESAIGLVDLVGILFLKGGAWQTAKMHAKHSTKDTYFYSFDFNSDDTMFRWLFMGHSEMPFDTGVTHADELLYIFSFPGVLEGQQLVVKDRMIKLWTNFAKYGNPTPDEDTTYENLDIPKWKPVTPDEHHFMLMQDEFTVGNEYPDRWHINLEEHSVPPTTPSPTPSQTPSQTPLPSTSPPGPSQEDYDAVVSERDKYMAESDTYMAVMITFVVLTALSILAAIGIFMKNRR